MNRPPIMNELDPKNRAVAEHFHKQFSLMQEAVRSLNQKVGKSGGGGKWSNRVGKLQRVSGPPNATDLNRIIEGFNKISDTLTALEGALK